MPRLTHRDTGVVVNVSDERAATLPSEFQTAKAESTATKAPAKKATSKK